MLMKCNKFCFIVIVVVVSVFVMNEQITNMLVVEFPHVIDIGM